jgi:hypothetical protein
MKGLRMGNKTFAFSFQTYEKSLINQCVDIMPHQMKGIESGNKMFAFSFQTYGKVLRTKQ